MPNRRSGDTASDLSNLSPYEVFPFASYIEGRAGREAFKRHSTLAHAKAAISGWRSNGGARPGVTYSPPKLYRWVGTLEAGRWEEISS